MRNYQAPHWIRFFSTDFSSLLPRNWADEVNDLVHTQAHSTVLNGDSETSREAPGALIPVRVVGGEKVAESLPWLVKLYETEFLEFSSQRTGKKLFRCNNVDDAININCITGNDARYEWHIDTNPVTGILYVETLCENSGGGLVFRKNEELFRFQPIRGWFCCFEGQNVEHAVEPLRGQICRTSIPMNYYIDADNTGRSASLNRYLSNKR